MSPAAKKSVINLSAIATAVVAVAGFAYTGGAEVASIVNRHWVVTDTFRVFQQGLKEQRLRDSNSTAAKLDQIAAIVAGLDSSDHCRRGFRDYCR